MADASVTSGDSGRTIDQHLEVIASPGTARTFQSHIYIQLTRDEINVNSRKTPRKFMQD